MANIERLRKLEEAVRLAPEDRFNINGWVCQRGCGTAACAAGWYAIATAPELKWNIKPGEKAFIYSADGVQMNYASWGEHFGISWRESEYLFDPGHYGLDYRDEKRDVRKDAVLKRIRAFIAEKEAEAASA